ncbi:MAG TPA: choice-of-anchor Q domain-containing protein [Cellvibrio sp.]|nr:choice-of-anchor Q domain-containing protein [Cellvibrio sp.]
MKISKSLSNASDEKSVAAKKNFGKNMIKALALATLTAPFSAYATDFKVTKLTDSNDGICNNDCSLREAITVANNTPGFHTIYLKAGLHVLSLPAPIGDDNEIYDEDNNLNGDLDIRGNIVIIGAAGKASAIDAKQIDRVFEVFENGTLTLRRMTLTGGFHHYDGGGIRNLGVLSLNDVSMIHNVARYGYSRGRGGAVANYGYFSAVNSEFALNWADFGDTSYALGGAVYNENKMLVRDSAFRMNHANSDDVLGEGGAIYNSGIADIGRTAFVGNVAEGAGNAIANTATGTLTLSNATIAQNYSDEYYPAGAITNFGTATLIHATISGNIRSYGLDNRGKVLVRNSIIVNNQVDFDNSDPINCINQGSNYQFRSLGLLLGGNYNNCYGDNYFPDALTSTSLFFPLERTEDHEEVFPLRPGSPALDASYGSCSNHDQRKLPRPQDGDGDGVAICDLGAYELQP